MINLDDYAEAKRDAATLAARREALVEQLGWLESEAEALAPLLKLLPPWAVAQTPLPTDLSVKETLSALAALDRETHPAWVRAFVSQDSAALETPDPLTSAEGANEMNLDDLLENVRSARSAFRADLAAVDADAWSRTCSLDGVETDLYGLALTIARRDADHLKELAYRLHSADVTMRPPPA